MAAKAIKGITISIGGDTEKLEKSLSDVYKKSKSLTGEMKEIDKAMRFNPKSIELAGQKQKVLSEQVENTRKRLDELKKAQEQVNEQYKNGEISEQQYRAFQREIVETESILKNYEGKLSDITDKHKILGDKLDEIGGKFQNAGKKMQDVGGAMTKGITLPILAIGGASHAAFLKVDEALDTIVTKTGATGDDMKAFEESFQKVGRTVPTDLQNVGDAIGEVNTQFGLTGEGLEDLSTQMIQFAEINGVDITNSSIKAKQAMEAFGMSAEDVPGILDAVTLTAQNTGQSTDSLFDSVIRGGPQLKALGLGFAESATLMGQFEQSGVDSNKALSMLSRSQALFAKEGLTLQEGLSGLVEEINNTESETEKLSLASEYFGTKGASFMLDAIERGALNMDELAAASENAGGTVASTFEETLDPADKMQLVMNDLLIAGNDLGLAIQTTLAPMLEAVAEKIRTATEWFQSLDEGQQQMIVKIGLVAAAMGPALVVFGKLTTGIGSIIKIGGGLIKGFGAIGSAGSALAGGLSATIGFLFSPAGAILVGIAAVVAGGVWLYKNWDTVKEKAGQLKEWVSAKWTELSTATSQKFQSMKNAAVNKIEETKQGVVNKATEMKNNFVNKVSEIKTNTVNKFNELKTGAVNSISNTVSNIRSKFSEVFNAIMSPINRARDGVRNAIDRMKSFFNFSWSLPKLKLPHFSVSGKFSLNPPSIPKFGIKNIGAAS